MKWNMHSVPEFTQQTWHGHPARDSGALGEGVGTPFKTTGKMPVSQGRCRRQAFTLIELLIVVGIIPITSIAIFQLIIGLGDARAYAHARLNAQESAAQTLARWRTDVELASRVEVGADGRSMTLWRAGTDQNEMSVKYERASGTGDLVRVSSPPQGKPAGKPEILAVQASGLKFSQIGRGYQVEWTTEYADGVRSWHWPQGAVATPLATGEVK